jgi:uncharacterized repeat protein (TIGR01451 family)
MKQLVIRIAALGTVVVLGLIAIAQAQRGVSDDSQTNNNTPSAAESSRNPMRSPLRTANGFSASSDSGNPLRARAIDNSRYDEPAVGRMVLDTDRTTVVHAAATSPVESAPPLSPFASRVSDSGPTGIGMARPLNTAPATASSAMGRFPDAAAMGLAAPASDTRAATAGDRAGRYSAPPTSAYSVADRYSATTTPARAGNPMRENTIVREGEPRRFRSDPFAPPVGIPSSTHNRTATRSVAMDSDAFAASRTGSASAMSKSATNDLTTLSGGEGTGQPGGKQLEGPQSPRLSIQKFAPDEIQVGKQATFKVAVVNTGETPAAGVEIHDQIPKGTRLVGTVPRATRGARGELVWNLGTIAPGDESVVEMQLMPVAEGEIGSVATVHFSAAASARTTSTRPQLVVRTSMPSQVLIGEQVALIITISNPGSGTATGVVLSEQIPAGLRHSSGNDLEYEVGDLKPGDTKKLELTLTAARAGKITNVLTARGEGNLRAEDRVTIEVLSPELSIAVSGSKRRYLEREATYKLSVANPGTAAAEEVELVAYLPSGLKFISANNAGYYEETDRSIRWRLQELPTGETGTVELVAMPVEEGQHKLRLKGTAKKGLAVEKEQPLSVEGITAIMFEAVDIQDPIEVGGETTYEIRVLNQGSKAATNVQVAVMLPPQMQAVAAEGPTRHVVDGNRILFDGLSRLAPKADITYRVRVKGLQPGDLRVSLKVKTNEMQTPVTKEESTRVYGE